MVMSTAERDRMLAQLKAQVNARHVIETRRLLSQPGLAAPTHKLPGSRSPYGSRSPRGSYSPYRQARPRPMYSPRESLQNKMRRIQGLLALQRAQGRRRW